MEKNNFNFEEWKKEKIKKGEWIPWEIYRKRKREEYSSKIPQLEVISHEILFRKKIIELDDKSPFKREIILDTETTGLSSEDRIVEISLLETIEGTKTGRKLHYFLNPEVRITKKAIEIHRLTNEKVKNYPLFKEVAQEIIKFIGGATIVAHNAKFDMRMINHELRRNRWEEYPEKRFIDTLEISRYLFPKEKNSQDALCIRFGIDNHNRMKSGIHSALEDTVHLYQIYRRLISLLEEKKLTPYDFKLNHTVFID